MERIKFCVVYSATIWVVVPEMQPKMVVSFVKVPQFNFMLCSNLLYFQSFSFQSALIFVKAPDYVGGYFLSPIFSEKRSRNFAPRKNCLRPALYYQRETIQRMWTSRFFGRKNLALFVRNLFICPYIWQNNFAKENAYKVWKNDLLSKWLFQKNSLN